MRLSSIFVWPARLTSAAFSAKISSHRVSMASAILCSICSRACKAVDHPYEMQQAGGISSLMLVQSPALVMDLYSTSLSTL